MPNSAYSRGRLKQRLFEEGLKERHCELCGQDESWRGRSMSLVLDHINGIPDDNRLANLRIVCPNCAATLSCGSRWDRARLRGRAQTHLRKAERPPYEQLLAEIEATGYCAVGRKYGVSDNAVRKWVRFYERERERRSG